MFQNGSATMVNEKQSNVPKRVCHPKEYASVRVVEFTPLLPIHRKPDKCKLKWHDIGQASQQISTQPQAHEHMCYEKK